MNNVYLCACCLQFASVLGVQVIQGAFNSKKLLKKHYAKLK